MLASGDGLRLSSVGPWLTTSAHYWGPNGLLIHVREHFTYTLIAVVLALLIALPVGLMIGHTGRGVVLIAGMSNGLRAVPTLGFVVLLVVWISPKIHNNHAIPGLIPRGGIPYVLPIIVVLVLLAMPPILTNTYAGVQAVDPAATDAARGMGMSELQIVRKVELPCALPLIMSGLRSATLQVIATATVAAYVPFLGGLGSLIIQGAQQLYDPNAGYPAMLGAGLTVAVLALFADVALLGLQKLVVSRGISGRVLTKTSIVASNTGSKEKG